MAAAAQALTGQGALPLYAAVSTDTGCFVYANTTANTHRVAAELLATGIDYFSVNKRHFRTKTKKRLALEADVRFQCQTLFRLGAEVPLVHREIVNACCQQLRRHPVGVGGGVGVHKAARIRGHRRVQRQRPLACQRLGGGGHAMAAGATVQGALEEVKRRVLEAVDAVKLS